MKTVYTKEELAEALKKGETALVKGSLASEIREKFEKRKKVRSRPSKSRKPSDTHQ